MMPLILLAQQEPLPPLPPDTGAWFALVVGALWIVREFGSVMLNFLNTKHKHRQEDREKERDENTELFQRAQMLNSIMKEQLDEVRESCRRQDGELNDLRRENQRCRDESDQLKEENRLTSRQLKTARAILKREGLLRDSDELNWPLDPPAPGSRNQSPEPPPASGPGTGS